MSKDAPLSKRKTKTFTKSPHLFLWGYVFLFAVVIHFRGWAKLFTCDEGARHGIDADMLEDIYRRRLKTKDSSPKIMVFVSKPESPNFKKLKQDLIRSPMVDKVVELDETATVLPTFSLPYCNNMEPRYKDLHSLNTI